MPWTVDKPPKVALNWTDAERRRCVAAANAVLADGGEDSAAVFACIHAAGRSKEKASAEEDKTVTEQKTVPFELTKVDANGRTFEGYASVFRSPDKDKADHTGDMVIAGAFKKSLAERGAKVRMLWQHDPSQPIGKFTELREDARGLYVKGVVSDTRLGRDCLALLKDKAIDSMSIGYDALPGGTEYVKGTDGKSVRLLKEVRLWEVSLVTFPADEQATVTQVKGALPFVATDKAPEGEAWDGPGVMAGCSGREQLRRVCAWVDPEGDPEAKQSYKLPHHMPDGRVVWRGVANAMARLPQASIPDSDVAAVARHLAGHYRQFDKPVPGEEPKADAVELSVKAVWDARLAELKEGQRVNRAMRHGLRQIRRMIADMLAGYDDEEEQPADDEQARRRKPEETCSTDISKADNPPAASTQAPEPEPEAQAGEDTQQPERKAGPGTEPPTSSTATDEPRTEEAGPDVTPPTSSEAKSQDATADPDDPMAEIARETEEIKALLNWR